MRMSFLSSLIVAGPVLGALPKLNPMAIQCGACVTWVWIASNMEQYHLGKYRLLRIGSDLE